MSVKVKKMKGNQNNHNNPYFLSYQIRNSKETSNSHISGSSGPTIGIHPGTKFKKYAATTITIVIKKES